MSGVKHTPGIWTAHKTIEAHDGMPECWQIDAEYDAVCTTQFCYAPNTEANARLIAAAPDLLEALVDFRAAMSADIPVGDGYADWLSSARSARDRADAAIARARGEQPPNHSDQKEVGNG